MTMRPFLIFTFALLVAWSAGLQPAAAQFEIKGLEIEKGGVEFEYNGDTYFGQPSRRFQRDPGAPAEFVFDENEVNRQRHNIELGYGVTDSLQLSVGVELEQERVDDPSSLSEAENFGSLKATSLQFEGTAILLPLQGNGVGLGLYGQLEPALLKGDANHFSAGPIIKAAHGPWSVTLNPLIGHLWGGESDPANGVFPDDLWSFEYQWQAAYQVNEKFAFAIEGYGAVNRLGDSGTPSEEALLFGDQDQHRVGPVMYYTFDAGGLNASRSGGEKDANEGGDDDGGSEVTMALGVLFGLNDDTADAALKWGLEVEF